MKKRAGNYSLCRVTFISFHFIVKMISFGAQCVKEKKISHDNDDKSWCKSLAKKIFGANLSYSSASAGKISLLWWMNEAYLTFASKKLIAFFTCLFLFNFLKLKLTHKQPPFFFSLQKFPQITNLIILSSSLELIAEYLWLTSYSVSQKYVDQCGQYRKHV